MTRSRLASRAIIGLTCLALSLAAGPAMAHPGHEVAASFQSGLAHPFGGWDHILAMFGVGFWATQQRGHAIWLLPVSFVLAVVTGSLVGVAGVSMPLVEQTILVSVVSLALAIVFKLQPRLPVAALVIAGFGLAHGFAHGAEAPGSDFMGYMLGFTLSTALLHAAGIALAIAMGRRLVTPGPVLHHVSIPRRGEQP
jgi:urease accessory protein